MKKKIFQGIAVVVLAAVFFGLYEYFRTPQTALEREVRLTLDSQGLEMAVGMENLMPGDVAEISGEIIAAESQSVELIGGVVITRSAEDVATWPKAGSATFKAKFDGVEEDEFFGELLYRFSGGFLVKGLQSKNLDQADSEE